MIKVNKKMHSVSIDWQMAKAIVEVLNYGMPDTQKKRDRLAKLSHRLEEAFEMELKAN
jgi:hypothetical protein